MCVVGGREGREGGSNFFRILGWWGVRIQFSFKKMSLFLRGSPTFLSPIWREVGRGYISDIYLIRQGGVRKILVIKKNVPDPYSSPPAHNSHLIINDLSLIRTWKLANFAVSLHLIYTSGPYVDFRKGDANYRYSRTSMA